MQYAKCLTWVVAAVVQLLTVNVVHDKTSVYGHADCPYCLKSAHRVMIATLCTIADGRRMWSPATSRPILITETLKKLIGEVPHGLLVEAQDMSEGTARP